MCRYLRDKILGDEYAPYWGRYQVAGLLPKETLKLTYEVADHYASPKIKFTQFENSILKRLHLDPLTFLQNVAGQGHKDAQYALGYSYMYGKRGVSQDMAQGIHWYTQAAGQGQKDAQFALGFCYGCGRGVSKDFQKELQLYTQAAIQGQKDAQFLLAIYYHDGKGVPQDEDKALYLYTQAAAQGHQGAREWITIILRQRTSKRV